MNLESAEFIRSLCPDFRWLKRPLKSEIKQVYEQELKTIKDHIITLNHDRIKANQTITAWSQRWALELTHEFTDAAIANLQTVAKRYGWIVSSLKHPRKATGGRITDADISMAKATPIENLYEGKLRPMAGRLSGCCPFHSEKSASFTIYKAQNSWWCYGCSQGGSVVDFVMLTRKCNFLEAIKYLIQK